MKILLCSFALLALASPAFASALDDLMATDRAFARMSTEKGYDEAYLAYLAHDGQTFTGPAPIRDKADALKRFSDPNSPKRDPRVKITWHPDTGGVSADGTMGWTEGRSRHAGLGVQSTGHYLTVWIKEDGRWKVRADMGATDPKVQP